MPGKTSFSFKFNNHKILHEGEDATPILMQSDAFHILGVFDGLGGAGSQKHEVTNNGIKTGAYIASRCAKTVVQQFFSRFFLNKVDLVDSSWIDKLENYIKQQLPVCCAKCCHISLQPSAQKIKSKSLAQFPTTMAILVAPKKADNAMVVVWAGDSRCFMLSPESGLQQLTEDDTILKNDALENIKNDSPLSNFIDTEKPFKLNFNSIKRPSVSILISCTDGCFSFLPTPMHFEFLFLDTLFKTETFEEFNRQLEQIIATSAGDDSSMSLVVEGVASYELLKQAFSERYYLVNDNFISPLNSILSNIRSAKEEFDSLTNSYTELRAKKWSSYTKQYSLYKNSHRIDVI
jgi:serine/threonine protein phosphatase PrpC